MMKTAKIILPLLMFTASTFTVFAQGNGAGAGSIPQGPLTAAKDRCAELQAQQGTTGSNEPETTEPEKQTNQPGNDVGAGGGNNSQADAGFDVSSITLQDCIDQGLTEDTPQTNQ